MVLEQEYIAYFEYLDLDWLVMGTHICMSIYKEKMRMDPQVGIIDINDGC